MSTGYGYSDCGLVLENPQGRVALDSIAKSAGTPTYVYSADILRERFAALRSAFASVSPLICFSVKCCHNLEVLRVLVEAGAGLDVVSGGELLRARLAGCDASRIAFAGVGKSRGEMLAALDGSRGPLAGEILARGGDLGPVGLFDIESEPELERLVSVAREVGVRARAAVRVNPDVQPRTHRHTATGSKETKFGLSPARAVELIEQYAEHDAIRLDGIHCHIGSQIRDAEPFGRAVSVVLGLVDELMSRGVRVGVVNLGGGFGIDEGGKATPGIEGFAAAIVPLLERHANEELEVVLEPGRWIAGPAGVLLTRVEYVKRAARSFVICDAGMHTFVRPSHYDAEHEVWPIAPAHGRTPGQCREDLARFDVVGPVCETGDYLALDRALPEVSEGDVLAVFDAGAYGMSMASTYNSHSLPAEVLIDGGAWRVVRPRGDAAGLVAGELGITVGEGNVGG